MSHALWLRLPVALGAVVAVQSLMAGGLPLAARPHAAPPPLRCPACLLAAVHEVGHRLAAAARGVELAPPLFIPAGLGLLGSFGAITRIKSFVPDRASLAAVAAAGPLASSAVALAVMLAGAAATAGGAGGVELDVASFRWGPLAGV